MENSGMKSFVVLEKARKFKKKRRWHLPKGESVLFLLAAFLCGRAELFSELMPFGGAFFAAVFATPGGFAYAFSALLGMASSGSGMMQIGKVSFAMCLFSIIFSVLYEKVFARKHDLLFIRSIIYTLCLAFSASSFLIASSKGRGQVLMYDVILLLVELLAAFVSTAAFCQSVPTFRRMRLHTTITSIEEISIVFLVGTALCGAKSISNIGIFNIADILCILVVLVFSVKLGTSRGAVAGLVMGLASSLSSGVLDSTLSYAVSGMAAGAMGMYGAIPGCCAFVLANSLVTALSNGSTEILINIYDIFAACVLYSLMPNGILSRITGFGARDEKQRAEIDSRLYGSYVLDFASQSVGRLWDNLSILDRKRQASQSEQIKFLERTARRACSSCGMRRLCWNRDARRTCEALKTALTEYCDSGEFNRESLPPNCLKPKEMSEAFLHMSELFRNDIIWSKKLDELRVASRVQLSAFQSLLDASKRKLREASSFDRALSDEVLRKLGNAGIACREVVAMRDSDLDPIISLTISECDGFSICDNSVEEIVSAVCGRKMLRAGRKDCKSCHITYVCAPQNELSFATSAIPRDKSHISGDSAKFRVISKSLYAAVLCDGMGSGEKAAAESALAAETLLDLIEAGLSGERAMEVVNASFLPFGETTFSAADLCLYTPKNGKVQIIKCGGAAAFSKSGGRVDAFYSKTMPLGATAKKDVETFSLSTGSGDLIVMVTDGVLGALSQDTWLLEELKGFHGSDVDSLCNSIAEKAVSNTKGSIRDDITVMAAFVK